jgi:hypothetical protein
VKIIECGPRLWDEQDHGLDYPAAIATVDFKLTGRGHERVERIYKEGCRNCRMVSGLDERQPAHRIAAWLCRYACSFVLFDTAGHRHWLRACGRCWRVL